MRVFKLYGRTYYKYIEGEPHLPIRENRLTVETNEHALHFSFLSDFGGYEVRESLNKSVFTKAVMQIINGERNVSDTITYCHGFTRDLEFHIHKDTVRLIFRVRGDYTRHRYDIVEITQFEFLKLSYFLQENPDNPLLELATKNAKEKIKKTKAEAIQRLLRNLG